jgi:hypothetical protein
MENNGGFATSAIVCVKDYLNTSIVRRLVITKLGKEANYLHLSAGFIVA